METGNGKSRGASITGKAVGHTKPLIDNQSLFSHWLHSFMNPVMALGSMHARLRQRWCPHTLFCVLPLPEASLQTVQDLT